jgi:hypothetical protein
MYGIIHRDGSGEDNPPLGRLSALYDELLDTDLEHGDVAVVHDDSHWCMSAYRDGHLVFEKLGTRGITARHMLAVRKEHVLNFWRRLIDGDIDGLLLEPWTIGYMKE